MHSLNKFSCLAALILAAAHLADSGCTPSKHSSSQFVKQAHRPAEPVVLSGTKYATREEMVEYCGGAKKELDCKERNAKCENPQYGCAYGQLPEMAEPGCFVYDKGTTPLRGSSSGRNKLRSSSSRTGSHRRRHSIA